MCNAAMQIINELALCSAIFTSFSLLLKFSYGLLAIHGIVCSSANSSLQDDLFLIVGVFVFLLLFVLKTNKKKCERLHLEIYFIFFPSIVV